MKLNTYTKYNNFGKTYILIGGVRYGNKTQRGRGFNTNDDGK